VIFERGAAKISQEGGIWVGKLGDGTGVVSPVVVGGANVRRGVEIRKEIQRSV
jgi:hypothetical protein